MSVHELIALLRTEAYKERNIKERRIILMKASELEQEYLDLIDPDNSRDEW